MRRAEAERARSTSHQVVLINPPSITQFAPVTFAMRGDASNVTIVATSRGVVNLPVGMFVVI